VFPVGLWFFSLVCDVVYLKGWGGPAWERTALYTLGGGIIGALLAAIPGLIDLFSIRSPRAKRLGLWHMILNLIAVAVFSVDFLLRLREGVAPVPPIALSVLGVVLIIASGWLGGELVYVHGVAVESRSDDPMAHAAPRR
jgi:uncharacterized membrane protein